MKIMHEGTLDWEIEREQHRVSWTGSLKRRGETDTVERAVKASNTRAEVSVLRFSLYIIFILSFLLLTYNDTGSCV